MPSPRVGAGRDQATDNDFGLIGSMASNPWWSNNYMPPVSGTIYGRGIHLYKGEIVTGVILYVGVAGVGTPPAIVRLGLSGPNYGLPSAVATDTLSTVVALSANVHADGHLTAQGPAKFPFTAAYTVTKNGLYQALLFKDSDWTGGGAVQAQYGRNQGTALACGPVYPGGLLVAPGLAGQADLPAVGNTWNITAAAGIGFGLALY
jgi:hypothetical protein